jgi:thioredoxin 1
MGFFDKLFKRTPKPGRPRPVTDETFKDEVLSSILPVAVDFWSRTCPPCHVMSGLLNELGPEYVGKLNIFKLNVDENRYTAANYQIRSIPTVILFYKGRPVDQIVGLIPLIPLREKLDGLVRRASR